MSESFKENIKQESTWIRGLYMLMFGIFYSLAEVLLFAIVVFQFVLKLVTGENNSRLLKLGQSIATYIYQVIQFLTFNSDYQPYPFGAWPKGEPSSVKKKKIEEAGQDEDINEAL